MGKNGLNVRIVMKRALLDTMTGDAGGSMFGYDPQYEEDIDIYLGEELRVNKLEDGTLINYVYECKSCGGAGGADRSKDCEIYDDWQPCGICDGTGEIEIE